MSKPNYHPLVWDTNKIQNFWNFSSTFFPWQKLYFTNMCGKGLLNFLQYITPMEGKVLDFGCGKGFLVRYLLDAEIHCEGIDSSDDSISALNQEFKDNPYWHGALLSEGKTLPYPDESFDFIFCLETIEHIYPEYLEGLFIELRRILKKNHGLLFVTTPNSENLDDSIVFCPECNAYFHRWQHLRSFTNKTLESTITQLGFKTITCNVTNFATFQDPLFPQHFWNWSFSIFYKYLCWSWLKIKDQLLTNKPVGGFEFQSYLGSGNNLFWLGNRDDNNA